MPNPVPVFTWLKIQCTSISQSTSNISCVPLQHARVYVTPSLRRYIMPHAGECDEWERMSERAKELWLLCARMIEKWYSLTKWAVILFRWVVHTNRIVINTCTYIDINMVLVALADEWNRQREKHIIKFWIKRDLLVASAACECEQTHSFVYASTSSSNRERKRELVARVCLHFYSISLSRFWTGLCEQWTTSATSTATTTTST